MKRRDCRDRCAKTAPTLRSETSAPGYGPRDATQLALSPNTVSTYRARILEKTGVRNDVELALYAVRQELLQV